MNKTLRTIGGAALCITGVIFTVIPGSILLVIAGLVLLSMDHLAARKVLKRTQRSMTRSAAWLDRWLLSRR
ncbi:PGPGW domain-containing protein [Alteromonas oceanisediminis]|uniref:PGPGW domain-containing protein n=1 Tax=Alteromonas oceanisediminis TaxID=2836180 RepID=UPI001BDAEFB3|nr:PGPGW domain-containing protein [Alteromonas oceanisediminis]MBT0586588.1 tellurium resistance protein TerC [Alteromonas oceanisediminis]